MTSMDAETLRRALRDANPALSRFDPLSRIVFCDDFDRGFCGWTQLVGNYEGSLDSMLPSYAQHSHPMLSTLPNWDSGSHNGLDGGYALRVQTRPRRGARNTAIKRLTFRKAGPIRLEFYFTFKPEASELLLSETDVRSVGFLYDLQSGDSDAGGERVMPHLRFLNALDGEHVQRWQFKQELQPSRALGNSGKTATHDHLSPEGWENLPGGEQRLCYNEIATKVNWHYACFDFDLSRWQATSFRINDRVFDMSGFAPMRMPAWRNLWCMLNIVFFVETDTDKRASLAIDGVCLSGEF
jgi:hypothetical protein